MKHKLNIILSTVLFVFIWSCKPSKEDRQSNTSIEKINKVDVPVFNGDSAYLFVKKQVDFGKRVPNTAPHILCGNYLYSTLKSYSEEVIVQEFIGTSFDKKALKLRNIVTSFNPKASKRIILAAHWDTRPFADQEVKEQSQLKPIDGANDGASGVGVLLEFARVISIAKEKPQVGIDIILFDGEDYGQPDFLKLPQQENTWCLGSQYWAANKHKANYQAYYGILLDMVGGKNAKFAMDGTSRQFAPEIQKSVWNTANSIGYSQYFIYQNSEQIIDDHLYVNQIAKIPMIDIIEYEPSDGSYFANTWHTLDDNLQNIDKNSLKAVGQTLLQVLYQE